MWDFENFQNPLTDKDCQLVSVRIRTILNEIEKGKSKIRRVLPLRKAMLEA